MPVKPRTAAVSAEDESEDTATAPARTAPLPVKSTTTSVASKATSGTVSTRSPKGPALTWNTARDQALLAVIKAGNVTRSAISTALQTRAEFAGIDPVAFSPLKVGNRLTKLRKAAEERDQQWIIDRIDMVTSQRKGGIDVDALEED